MSEGVCMCLFLCLNVVVFVLSFGRCLSFVFVFVFEGGCVCAFFWNVFE